MHICVLVGCTANNINIVYVLKSKSTPCRLANNRSCESFEGAQYRHLQDRAGQSSNDNFTLQLKTHTAFEKSITICQSIGCEVTEVTTIRHGLRTSKLSFIGVFAKLRKETTSCAISIRAHGTTRFPLDGFCLKSIFEYF